MHFFDSNILVYAFSEDLRNEKARALLTSGGIVSVQSLNEFTNVALRKLKMNWDEIHQSLDIIHDYCDQIVPLTLSLHEQGIMLAARYKISLYDAMIAAAALEAGCDILYSEDLQHGLLIEQALTVQNPFV